MDSVSIERVWDSVTRLREEPDAVFDMVLTDPPYCSGGLTTTERKAPTSRKYFNDTETGASNMPDFTGDDRDQRGYLAWASLWLSEALRVTKPGGVLCVFTDWRQLPITTDAVQAAGWRWRGIVVWDKTEAARPHPGSPRAQAEYVVWGTRGPRAPEHMSLQPIPGVLRAPIPRDRDHPTQKPLAVLRPLCALVPPGALILDPFCGAGSTLLAASLEGRRAVGWEREACFVEYARARLGEIQRSSAVQGDLLMETT